MAQDLSHSFKVIKITRCIRYIPINLSIHIWRQEGWYTWRHIENFEKLKSKKKHNKTHIYLRNGRRTTFHITQKQNWKRIWYTQTDTKGGGWVLHTYTCRTEKIEMKKKNKINQHWYRYYNTYVPSWYGPSSHISWITWLVPLYNLLKCSRWWIFIQRLV